MKPDDPSLAAQVSQRPPLPHYHPGEVNVCASCGNRAWHVGRKVAQCTRCDAALPLNMPEPTNPAHPFTKQEKEAA